MMNHDSSLSRIDTEDLLPFPEQSENMNFINLDYTNHTENPNFSVFSQMCHQEQMQMTPNVSHLYENPCLDDLDTEFEFEVDVPMEENEKKQWYYDAPVKRLYVKMDQPLTAIISYKALEGNLFVRVMPIYTARSDVRLPVNRCPNHKDKCNSGNREHLVHYAGHDQVQYLGLESGEKFNDRLAVLIPLKKARGAMGHVVMREEICFSIGCLNSCSSGINRRSTALIITLENESMEILGRKIMNFRACSSPKRDYDADNKKRLGSNDLSVPLAKRPMIIKQADGTTKNLIKMEDDVSSQESVPQSPSGETILTLTLPNPELALDILKYTQNLLSGEVTRGNKIDKKYFKQINKHIEEAKAGHNV